MAKYAVTRDAAAQLLGVSTRTIDRYIKSRKLSYKKVANKVLLNNEEVLALKEDYDMLHEQQDASIVSYSEDKNNTNTTYQDLGLIDQKLEKFLLVTKEKDRLIEDKNKVIFLLQQRIGELETKLQYMVSLPDHTEEKKQLLLEKDTLTQRVSSLEGTINSEKNKSLILVIVVVICFLMTLLFFLTSRG